MGSVKIDSPCFFIKKVDFEVGSNILESHHGHWLDVLNELTDHNEFEYTILNKHSRKDNPSYLITKD